VPAFRVKGGASRGRRSPFEALGAAKTGPGNLLLPNSSQDSGVPLFDIGSVQSVIEGFLMTSPPFLKTWDQEQALRASTGKQRNVCDVFALFGFKSLVWITDLLIIGEWVFFGERRVRCS